MNKRKLSNGRKKAFQVMKRLGNRFHKNTAMEKLENEGIENPQTKWDFLVKNGYINHVEKDIYMIK